MNDLTYCASSQSDNESDYHNEAEISLNKISIINHEQYLNFLRIK